MTINENGLPDSAALRVIVDRIDPVGTLSVYATADPHDAGAWRLRVVNELIALEQRLRKADDGRAEAVAVRLDEVERELAAMLDASGPGQGRALFVPLSDGPTHSVAVHAMGATRRPTPPARAQARAVTSAARPGNSAR